MKSSTPLSHKNIIDLHQAVSSAGLSGSRAPLMVGLPPDFAASFPEATNPAGQILLDLGTMNSTATLADGTIPLEVWLENALILAAARQEAIIFERALAQVRTFAQEAGGTPEPALHTVERESRRFLKARFDSYFSAWTALQKLRQAGDALWDEATSVNLEIFAQELKRTIDHVENHAIFFRESDYRELQFLLRHFANYHIGKNDLIEAMEFGMIADESARSFMDEEARAMVEINRACRKEYKDLLDKIRQTYRDHLSTMKQ